MFEALTSFLFNAIIYIDKNLAKEVTTKRTMDRNLKHCEIKRGDIFFIHKDVNYDPLGSEQQSARPAVVVSNNAINNASHAIEVVYLTTKDKKRMRTHVTIWSTGTESTALCEQVHTVSDNRIGVYCGACTESELARIDRALITSLGLEKADYDQKQDDTDTFNNIHEQICEATQELANRLSDLNATLKTGFGQQEEASSMLHQLQEQDRK